LAQELGEIGASERDIADSIAFYRETASTLKGRSAETREAWLPYLERRLNRLRSAHDNDAGAAAEQGDAADGALPPSRAAGEPRS